MTDQAPDTGELTYTRVFDAPRELVFRCMLEPEHLTHFWGPAGVSTPLETIKVDPRPGGVFETIMVSDSDGSRYPTRAVYVEITEPERIVWTEPGTGMTTISTYSACIVYWLPSASLTMTVSKTPPGRASTLMVASGVLIPAGPQKWVRCSGSSMQRKTRSLGASNTRV